MEINQVIRISDQSLLSKGTDIISRECARVAYPLVWEISLITYRAHTWKATHGYRIQGDPAIWVRIDVYPL